MAAPGTFRFRAHPLTGRAADTPKFDAFDPYRSLAEPALRRNTLLLLWLVSRVLQTGTIVEASGIQGLADFTHHERPPQSRHLLGHPQA
jgi:hypothetical protein